MTFCQKLKKLSKFVIKKVQFCKFKSQICIKENKSQAQKGLCKKKFSEKSN